MIFGPVDLILAGLAALFGGLWWGERGRRLAAERWQLYGTPEPVATAKSRAAPESALPPGPGDADFDEAVDRGAAQLEAMGAREGWVKSKVEWREEARAALTQGLR